MALWKVVKSAMTEEHQDVVPHHVEWQVVLNVSMVHVVQVANICQQHLLVPLQLVLVKAYV
jgi:hypothetical protein